MNKRKFAKIAAIACAILAALAYFLPGVFRSGTVAAMGVVAANTIATVTTVIAAGLALIMIAAVVFVVSAAVKAKRAKQVDAVKNRPYVLPSATETDPAVIRKGLEHVAKKFSNTSLPIEIAASLEDLELIQASIANVNALFIANPLLVIDSDSRLDYTAFTLLLTDVQREVCMGLIRIIYQAHTTDHKDREAFEELLNVTRDVNAENQSRIAKVRKLTDEMVKVSTRTNSDNQATATDQLTTLVAQLSGHREIANTAPDPMLDPLLNPTITHTPQPIHIRKETR